MCFYIKFVYLASVRICKKNYTKGEIKKQDKLRVNMIREVTNIKQKVLTLEGEGFSSVELDEMTELVNV